MLNFRDILIMGECENGRLSAITREMIGGARRLADQIHVRTCLLLIGSEKTSLDKEAISYGIDKVFLVQDDRLAGGNQDLQVFVMADICKKINPSLCFFGQTDLGRDIAPRLAVRLDAGLCMDCVDIKIDPDQACIYQTRPVYGGKAMAVMAASPDRLQINTIRAKSMESIPADHGREGETILVARDVSLPTSHVSLLKREEIPTEGLNLEDAKVIVAGGGGIGGPNGFELIRDLARLLNGAVGATRVPVDEHWVPLSMEIGQTGKIVSPDLYIAVGISGATQHITGCLRSKRIVTINKDPEANMFKISDVGLAADYNTALPILIEKIRTLKKS